MLTIPHTNQGRWPSQISAGRFAASIQRDNHEGCRIALLGLPDDTGVKLNHGRSGAAHGPKAFREALAGYGSNHSEWRRVFDAGDVEPAESLEATHDRVTAATSALLDAGLFPIAIGGGHDLTYPFVRAVAAKYPQLAAIYFDAHLDVRETPGSGMPFRNLIEDCGVSSLHLHGYRPLVNATEHHDWFTRHGGKHYPDGTPVSIPPEENIFASFDLDVLDASHAPGVSALNPAGWTVREAEQWVRACGKSPNVRCFDVMELNPLRDADGRTARVAAHLFMTFIEGFSRR
jgi:formiminoglutamase